MSGITSELTAVGLLVRHHRRPDWVPSEGVELMAGLMSGVQVVALSFTPAIDVDPVGPKTAAQLVLKTERSRTEHVLSELASDATWRQILQNSVTLSLMEQVADFMKASAPALEKEKKQWRASVLVRWLLVVVFAPVLFTLLFAGFKYLTAGTGAAQVISAPAPAGGATPTPASAQMEAIGMSTGDQLTANELLILKDAVVKSGITLSKEGGGQFVVFSDPSCPACQAYEEALAAVGYKDAPIVIPVSFKPGSEEIVAGILCSKDPGQAWKNALKGKKATPCAAGITRAKENNAAFIALRLDSTPTFVTAKGKLAKGAKDLDGLMAWVRANAN